MVSNERLLKDKYEKTTTYFGKCRNIGYGWKILLVNGVSTLYAQNWFDSGYSIGYVPTWYKVADVTGWSTERILDYVISTGDDHIPQYFYDF